MNVLRLMRVTLLVDVNPDAVEDAGEAGQEISGGLDDALRDHGHKVFGEDFSEPVEGEWFVDRITGRLVPNAAEVAAVVSALVPKDAGWAVFEASHNGYEIERDDEAGLFEYDEDAIAAAIKHLESAVGRKVGV